MYPSLKRIRTCKTPTKLRPNSDQTPTKLRPNSDTCHVGVLPKFRPNCDIGKKQVFCQLWGVFDMSHKHRNKMSKLHACTRAQLGSKQTSCIYFAIDLRSRFVASTLAMAKSMKHSMKLSKLASKKLKSLIRKAKKSKKGGKKKGGTGKKKDDLRNQIDGWKTDDTSLATRDKGKGFSLIVLSLIVLP